MKKVKKAKKMCEYTKYKIAASSIATLLGVWGPARQYNEICTLAKRPHREQTESWSASSKRFLEQCGISQEWDALKLRAGTSAFQEHIEVVSKQATDLLLNNRLVDTVVDLDALDNMDPRLVLCRELRNSVVSIATKAYGRNSEPIFIQQFNSCIEESGQIHSMQHELFRQCGDNRTMWAITGRVDGFQHDHVVEIKHRRALLFASPPDYELMQVHAYMFASGKHTTKLFQCVRRQDFSVVDTKEIKFCEVYWSKIVQSLGRAIEFVEKLVASDLAWDAFASCDQDNKAQLLRRYI